MKAATGLIFMSILMAFASQHVHADPTPPGAVRNFPVQAEGHRASSELSFYFPAAWYQGEFRRQIDLARTQASSQRSRLGVEFSGYFPTTAPKCEWNLGVRVSGDHVVQDGGSVFHWMIPIGFRYIASGSVPDGFLFRVAVGPTLSHGTFEVDQPGSARFGGGLLFGISYQAFDDLAIDVNHVFSYTSGGLTELLGLGITVRIRSFEVGSLFRWPLELLPHAGGSPNATSTWGF